MTTTVKIHVNGRYKATVITKDADGTAGQPYEVHGNYEGSPNPSGEYVIHAYHPARVSFDLTEEYLGEAKPAE